MKLGSDVRFSRWLLAQDEVVLRNAEIEWHDELPRRAAARAVGGESSGCAIPATSIRSASPRGPRPRSARRGAPRAAAGTGPGRPCGMARAGVRRAGQSASLPGAPGSTIPWRIVRGDGALRLGHARARRGPSRDGGFALSGVSSALGEDLARCAWRRCGRLQGSCAGDTYRVARARSRGCDGEAARRRAEQFRGGVERRADAGGSFAASALELEPLARLAASLPLPERPRKLLAEVKPRGRLAEARSMARRSAGAGESPRKPSSSTAPADRGAPEFAGISGSFDATESSARVVFATRKGELYLPRVFPAAAHAARLPERPGRVGAPGRRRVLAAARVAQLFQRAVERQCARHLQRDGDRDRERSTFPRS